MNGSNFSTFGVVSNSDQLPGVFYYALGVVFVFVMVTATGGNGVFLYVFLKSKTLRTPNYFLVSALCLGDVLMSTLGIPMFIIANFSTYWIFGEIWCTIYGTLMTFSGFVQITLLASIACIRYFFVVKNESVGTYAAKLIVISCYAYSFIFALAPHFGWSRFVVEPVGTSCGPNWMGNDSRDVSYNITIVVMCFFVPLTMILYSYIMIFLKVRNIFNSSIIKYCIVSKKKFIHSPQFILCITDKSPGVRSSISISEGLGAFDPELTNKR